MKWLRQEAGFRPNTVMIDCSATEALAINLSFPDIKVHILYCYWHLWQAWEKNIKDKVSFVHFFFQYFTIIYWLFALRLFLGT